MNAIYKKIVPISFGIFSILASSTTQALPFTILPTAGTTLPKIISKGETVKAFYTVTNNTQNLRVRNFVKYLPPNVTQVKVDPATPNLCGDTFTLNRKGTPGSSCTLELRVSGPVKANDPNPHHHLFVCFPGGISCAGTPKPLNVKRGKTQTNFRFAYVGNHSSINTVSKCAIANNGKLVNCQSYTGNGQFKFPTDVAFNASGKLAYVTNSSNIGKLAAPSQIVILCSVNPNNGALNHCANAFQDNSAPEINPLGITLNATGTFAYIGGFSDAGIVASCAINPLTGKLHNCKNNTGSPLVFETPLSLAFLHGIVNQVYVADAGGSTNNIFLCRTNQATGKLNCEDGIADGSASVLDGPEFLSITSSNSRIYISNNALGNGKRVVFCSINRTTHKLFNCQDSGLGPIFKTVTGISLNATDDALYVVNNLTSTVSLCPIDIVTGKLISCMNAAAGDPNAFDAPEGITLYK